MEADIITIGDELLIGQVLDTNSGWIASHLNAIGIRINRRIAVGDIAEQISDTLDISFKHSEVVIMTGGLGPTKDDITKQTLARWFGVGLVMHTPTYDHVERMLTARGVEFNDLNRSQAMVLAGCRVLANPNGTAPGMWMERGGKVLVSLPGVPFEMKGIMEGEALGLLRERFALSNITHRTAICFGLAESMLAERIAAWEDALPPYFHLAYLPGPWHMRLRLSIYDMEPGRAECEIEEQFERLQKLIPEYFVGFSDSVAAEVADLLTSRKATLAVAESCTGGALGSSFTEMAGASNYFLGGIVAYSNDLKRNILGVDAAAIERRGAVSQEVAVQMAEGARRVCGADYAIATTGIAGPAGGSPEKPVGTVWIAVAGPEGVYAQKFVFGSLREQNIARAAATAENMLRLLLTGQIEKINPRPICIYRK